jgi:DNA-binding response OmpR family regulator
MDRLHCFPALVEDDDNFALLLRRALRKAGVPDGNVRWYRDGEGALADLLSVDAVPPSVVLLDLDLPGISGLSVLAKIRSCGPLENLPAFILSGREDPAPISSATALRAGGYWVKPWSCRELQDIVESILGNLEMKKH